MTKPKKTTKLPKRAVTAIETLLDDDGIQLMRELIRKAVAGNITALRLCIERRIPVHRERALPVRIPAAQTAVQITRALGAVLNALSEGQLTPGEAQKLAAILESQRKAIETGEFEERLNHIEEETRKRRPANLDTIPIAPERELPCD